MPNQTPPPLRGSDQGTFTEYTIKERFPNIVQRVLDENELDETAVDLIQNLLHSIPNGKIRPLLPQTAPDLSLWQTALTPFLGMSWLEAPWFVVETYLFRRIVEAVNYFESGLDPFAYQKQRSLNSMMAQVGEDTAVLQKMMEEEAQETHLRWLLLRDLWGNQVDLGLWSADDSFDHLHQEEDAQLDHLLVNDLTAVTPFFQNAKRLDFIIDNAGYELVGDFLLALYWLAQNQDRTIHFHVKRHPTFVSDVTKGDVQKAVETFINQENEDVRWLGKRLADVLENGRLQLHDPLFWTSPHPLWHLPQELNTQLAKADLIISKGDANYRRALGDLHWPYETPIREIVDYLDAPILFLRTCKSEVLAGLENGRAAQLRKQYPNWDVSGEWGVVQLVSPGKARSD